jgi:hypothetical protein
MMIKLLRYFNPYSVVITPMLLAGLVIGGALLLRPPAPPPPAAAAEYDAAADYDAAARPVSEIEVLFNSSPSRLTVGPRSWRVQAQRSPQAVAMGAAVYDLDQEELLVIVLADSLDYQLFFEAAQHNAVVTFGAGAIVHHYSQVTADYSPAYDEAALLIMSDQGLVYFRGVIR